MIDKNSMTYWYPLIKNLPIPQPKTVMVPVQRDYKGRIPAENVIEIRKAANQIGYPLFMRTNHLSAKHEWSRTCYVEKAYSMEGNIMSLMEASEMCDMLGKPLNALVFREFIEMDSPFTAFNGLPISRERRYFIKDGTVQCHHPYWIEDAIQFWGNLRAEEPPRWKELLKELNTETKIEVKLLTAHAELVAETLHGYWSVDFCMAKDEMWYLIDCAQGEHSWHPECEFHTEKDRQ